MISKQQIMPMLVEACPSFSDLWKEGRTGDFVDSDGTLLDYLALGALARHLVTLASAGEVGEFPAVFAVVETLHTEGDHHVREAATIGLLEGIQNHAERAGLDKEMFLRWLGPESRKWWGKLERFWDGNPSALNE